MHTQLSKGSCAQDLHKPEWMCQTTPALLDLMHVGSLVGLAGIRNAIARPSSMNPNDLLHSTMSSSPAPHLQDGSPIPRLIYGTSIHEPPHPQPDVLVALRHGYRGVDTASSRKFHSEIRDGEAIREATTTTQDVVGRESLLIQTKYTSPYGHPRDQSTWPYHVEDSPSLRVLKSVARSVEDLQVDAIDVYFLHRPLDSLPETLEAWQTLEDIVRRGGVRYLGLCNVCASMLGQVWDRTSIKPLFVQNPFRKDGLGYDVEVVRYCQQKGIVYQIFGLFSPCNEELFDCEPVSTIMGLGATKHQALIRALLEAARAIGLTLCILSGTTSERHMGENMAALESKFKVKESTTCGMLKILGWDSLGEQTQKASTA